MNATPAKFQPLRSPEPGRPFVNRERELKLVQDKLDIGIQGKPMSAGVICFWGAFGMGKSWLLLELERRHRHAGSYAPGSRPPIAARLDLNRAILPARIIKTAFSPGLAEVITRCCSSVQRWRRI